MKGGIGKRKRGTERRGKEVREEGEGIAERRGRRGEMGEGTRDEIQEDGRVMGEKRKEEKEGEYN